MANIKDILNSSDYDSVNSILKVAGTLGDKEGIETYVVGGFVRDLLMGNTINDIDIMTVGEGIPFAERLATDSEINFTLNEISRWVSLSHARRPSMLRKKHYPIGGARSTLQH